MSVTLTDIWRHPIKGIGCQRLPHTNLSAGAPLPGDRAWALLHHGAAADTDTWQPRRNFLVVANGPRLAQITASTLPSGLIHLRHPDLDDLTFDPGTQGVQLINWITPIWPDTLASPSRLVSAPDQGMADNGVAQISIMNHASLRALSQRVGHALDPRRFRGNLWLDGLAPWEEFDWIGKTLRIGHVTIQVTDRIQRCRATEANPDTGRRDVEPVKALHAGWGHQDFGVYATVMTDGKIATDDLVTLP